MSDSTVPPPKWTEDVLVALAWAEGDDRNRIIAFIRESALREAALIALAEMRMDIRNAILALIAQPPKEAGWVIVPPDADSEITRRAKAAYQDHPFFARMKDIEREIAKNGWLVAPPKETK